MNFNIKNEDLVVINGSETPNFPKYTSQLINWANQNAQGTRPRVVGQLSDLFPEYEEECDTISIDSWREWYLQRYPNAIENATNKIYDQVQNLQKAITLIDKEMVMNWVNDLVIDKTYNGLYVQKAILEFLADKLNVDYRLATPEEESHGIDGFVGGAPYSVKPESYKTMGRLLETIDVKMIYYTKTKTGLKVEVED